jgi:hypothetical protein
MRSAITDDTGGGRGVAELGRAMGAISPQTAANSRKSQRLNMRAFRS